ncbi:hypothetical protein FHX42_000828 [Saccharopolyspora lacisalsi]|uniref:Uncharacterized protein n=1 Tax=Halosaccharopolyspora lacisalsi TaxID=1000566 RepID=A0A839DRY7_9PSEU|nr:hypothetical protein [Halosaccharopolyspora lacisalsi]MBA8823499.1 hypothetical protein [Halosaccharopolyspora lacisalsi]
MSDQETVPLDLLERSAVRKRARNVGVAAIVFGAAFGGVVGVLAGPVGFFSTLVILALPLLLLSYAESRKTYWLRGTEVAARAFGTRAVELSTAEKLNVVVTDLRGARTVSLLVSGPPKNKALNVAVAMYAGTGGKELGIYSLRRLADALASTGDTRALVLSQLLVAQLKAEARGDAAADRPLYRLASLAPQGRMAQRLDPDDVSRFVTTLE